ncbi:hypothetical protein ACG7TL_001517 [Trametes sanguinea]
MQAPPRTIQPDEADLSRRDSVLQQTADTLCEVLTLFHQPLTMLLSICFISLLAVAMGTFTIDIVTSSLTSCDMPAPSHSPPYTLDIHALPHAPLSIDHSSLVQVQNALIGKLAVPFARGIELASNVKRAELAVRDLAGLVRTSNLTTRDALMDNLDRFAVNAPVAGRHVQTLSYKALGALDSIATLTTHGLSMINTLKDTESQHVDAELARTFQMSVDTLVSQIAQVHTSATEAAGNLQHLQEALYAIHELSTREALLQDAAIDDLLRSLWTLCGGNRERLRDLRFRVASLQEVQRFRRMASAYIAAATQSLWAMYAELAELGGRMTVASVMMGSSPMNLQLAAIERTLARLNAGETLVVEEHTDAQVV